ncbi:hydroxymethylbilane synthase [Sphingobium nicotianae]|uniref:Porphobilinogen deaminase n=1 Tax=Sphingobium nicotianae TaxID=2782607 RepID=A0A9X1IPS1_9SPHN|nr:hydroxymethylbilane synthase [Sphingobium nicotianae]MBT2186267.1 hydroxymethylbilane synthase [Sphingobium nicotianae]
MPTPSSPFRIGSRGSPLALAQAELTIAALIAAHGWPREAIRIVTVTTSGDRIQDRALAEVGGKALWTKELDRALLDGEIDCSVHSMKDVETIRPESIRIAAMLPRAAVEDRLIGATSIEVLPQGAVIGTSSPRRAAQLKALRPDLQMTLLRGNVATRLARVEAGDIDATLLAAAGLDRLGLGGTGTAIPVEAMIPAVAQGAVGIECRADDARAQGLLDAINHGDTARCVRAERALLLSLGGTCHSPIAALARPAGADIHLRAQILSEDGSEQVTDEALLPGGDTDAAMALGARLLDHASPALRALFTR